MENRCADIWVLRYVLSNVTVGRATADASGNNISDTYATKSDTNYWRNTLQTGDGQTNANMSVWAIMGGRMIFITVEGYANNSNDRTIYFPDGYHFADTLYASNLTIYDNNHSNLWSYNGRILEKTTSYIKFKFQQASNSGGNTTSPFTYCLTLFGST